MTGGAPIVFTWTDDGAMKPLDRFARLADKRFVVGLEYPLEIHYPRSKVSHDHEFAWLGEAWATLPERYKHEPWALSPDHLRKYCLIRKGFCNTQTYACGSRSEAERWAQNLRPIDEYSLVTVEGTTVYRFTAESQSYRAMGARRFQESKQAIFDYIAELLEVSPDELARSTGVQRPASPSLAPEAPHRAARERVA